MIDRRTFLAASSAALLVGAARGPKRFELQDNRVFVTVQMSGAKGKARDVLCWFDTGGGGLQVTKDVAAELGLTFSGPVRSNEGLSYQSVTAPRVFVQGTEIIVPTDDPVIAELDGRAISPSVRCQGFLPGYLLRPHRVLIDYPARRFGLNVPADLSAERLPVRIDPASGFVRLDCIVDGEHVGLLLDTGASATMLSRAFIDKLVAKHPDWKSAQGAYGPANMHGAKTELDAKMLRIPQLAIGNTTLRDVVAVSRPAGVFEKWMSGMVPAPIVGALGGNALRNLRLQIDFAKSQLTAIHTEILVPHEFDMVPITLRATFAGYEIVGVLPDPKMAPLRETLVGKNLIAVDEHPVASLGIGDVLALLRGEPGGNHRLRVGGASGAPARVDTPILRIL